MSDETDQREDEYRSRGHKRRAVRAVHEQRQKWIDQILRRPIETWPRWDADPEFDGLLNQLRRTKQVPVGKGFFGTLCGGPTRRSGWRFKVSSKPMKINIWNRLKLKKRWFD